MRPNRCHVDRQNFSNACIAIVTVPVITGRNVGICSLQTLKNPAFLLLIGNVMLHANIKTQFLTQPLHILFRCFEHI